MRPEFAFIEPGKSDLWHYRYGEWKTIPRLPGETDEELIARVLAEKQETDALPDQR